jgi:peptide subunit release factor 1 (eRF1)
MTVENTLNMLAAFAPTTMPVISLYLNTQPDEHGRANYESFVRKELTAQLRSYPLRSPERASLERDAERINYYLSEELRPSSNGLALFACAGENDFFEAVQLDAPIAEHRLYVYHQPHLYPLARVSDQYRRYAVLVADTNAARLFVFGLGTQLNASTVQSPNVNWVSLGGLNEARYQSHIKNYHLHHAKEVVEALDQLVRKESIEQIWLAGDEVIIPILKQQLPPHLSSKVVDVLRLDIKTPEHKILAATLEAVREQDAKDDAEKVARLFDQYHAGMATLGAHDTLVALSNGQVDELYLSASLEAFHDDEETVGAQLVPGAPTNTLDQTTRRVLMADELVTRAQQTGASFCFIEDAALLEAVGGIGATLRYRL